MNTRRNFLFGIAPVLIGAPVIVQVQTLMPLRGIVLPSERYYFGFTDRLYVYSHLPKITALQSAGLSVEEIAADFNRHGRWAMNRTAWDAQSVMCVIKRDKFIRREDLLRRAERLLRS
jgi:hypothetical protein